MTTFDQYSLTDRYTRDEGRVFLTGVQALSRLPIEQLRADRTVGLSTAAFLSGYQGSPLGGFDQEMTRAMAQVPDLDIVLQPAVNEELGATAVMGSQLVANQPGQRHDGVVGYWYGKAPGLDRAGDAIRHAVFAGTSPTGGAVALVGDDPASKSSTLPTSSDTALVGLLIPVLYPGDVSEISDLGRHAVALSRLAGLWTSLKIVTPVADGTATVDLVVDREPVRRPDLTVDGRAYVSHPDANLLAPNTLTLERELREVRLEIARRYGMVNELNSCPVDPPDAWLGLAASGYTYHELRHALARLGLADDRAVAGAGIRLLHLRMPFPLEPAVIRSFGRGLEEIVVVEEKGPTLERLVKDALYNAADRPRVVGKADEEGGRLMPSHALLDADTIAAALRPRLERRLADRLAPPPAPARERTLIPLTATRKPYFCSGCPHNWGTKVPDDALVGAGIGCHGMALLMEPDRVGDLAGITAMGGEGAQWIGMAPFLERDHFIQNLGDGTFFHSGQLAVQAAVAAGVNITYKLLYNGTVAMTGGQDAAGAVPVPELASILLAHGVARVLVTTDDVDAYRGVELPVAADGTPVEVWDRSRIVEAQELLASVPGVTVLIHDQACAAQARRLRKRGQAPTPGFRVAINHRICEACGHCGEISNCLSVQSIDTPLGPKTTIDQTSCNLDFSCLDGDCPSFMTISVADDASAGGGRLARGLGRVGSALGRGARRARRPIGAARGGADAPLAPAVPEPIVGRDELALRFAGIGGTGVVTVAQIVGTAAMLDGWQVRGLDQTGLSQKAGPVVSDLRLSRRGPAGSNLIGAGEADVIVAFDLLVGASDHVLASAHHDRTVLVASSSETPTGEMIGHPERSYPSLDLLDSRIATSTRADHNRVVDAGRLTRGLFGDAATANVFLVGVALQAGCLPIDPAAVERAIDLNGVAVEANLASFRWGRTWIIDPDRVRAAAGVDADEGPPGATVAVDPLPPALSARIDGLGLVGGLDEVVRMLTADLVAYQDEGYAGRLVDLVATVAAAEARVTPASTELTEAVARGYHKLAAYKDEYEVARLLVGPEGRAAARSVGGDGATVHWRLHPPLLRALGMTTKLSLPAAGTAPVMRALAAGKRLRGTALDPFGRAEVRRVERELVVEYRRAIEAVAASLDLTSLDEAVQIARLAQEVRGYEDIKLRQARPVLVQLRAVSG